MFHGCGWGGLAGYGLVVMAVFFDSDLGLWTGFIFFIFNYFCDFLSGSPDYSFIFDEVFKQYTASCSFSLSSPSIA